MYGPARCDNVLTIVAEAGSPPPNAEFFPVLPAINPVPKSPVSGSTPAATTTNAVCPFCSLLCDDLTIRQRPDGDLQVTKNGCARSREGYARPRATASARVDGKRATRKDAAAAAARLLKRAQAPLFGGLGTDVDGVRGVVALAERSRGILDHANSHALGLGMRVLQSRGWYLTTLAEVRNRADLVVIVGADLTRHYTRFVARTLAPRHALHPERRERRRVVFIGRKDHAPAADPACPIETVACAPAQLPEFINLLRAAVAGRRTAARGAKRPPAHLAEAIRAAAYPVFVWAPAHLPPESADLVIHAVTRLIDDLNKSGRAAGLALGGDNGGVSAVNTCAWLTGYPLRVSFAGDTVCYDPVRNRGERLIDEQTIDAMCWVDAFGALPAPPTPAGVRRIVIASGDPGASATDADVFIPVGTPGVDHGGRLVRTDSVVTLYSEQVRRQSLASVRDVIDDILAAW